MGSTSSERKVEAMTTTLDRQAYGILLSTYQPQVIQSESAYRDLLASLESLLEKGENLTAEESAMANLLAAIIEDYEEQRINSLALEAVAPHDILRHLMAVRNLKQADLLPLIGSRAPRKIQIFVGVATGFQWFQSFQVRNMAINRGAL